MPKNIIIHIIGDSTVANNDYPQAGWGQVLDTFFNNDVRIINYAKNGRSTKSFIDEGLFDTVISAMETEDQKEVKPIQYLLIQFGHNDEKDDPKRHTDPFTSFSDNFRFFINSARKTCTNSILISPVQRRKFDTNKKLLDTHGDYPLAVKKVSLEMNVPFIDLSELSKKYLINLAEEESVEVTKRLFMWFGPRAFKNFPEGKSDDTHFNVKGAKIIANLVTQEIKKLNIQPLANYLLN